MKKFMSVGELIEELKKFPLDNSVVFYDEQYEKVMWDVTKVYMDDSGTIIMMNDDYGI